MKAAALELDFVLTPLADRVTTSRLAIQIQGTPVWPVEGDDAASLEIQIDDLLSHLAEHWHPLMLRQVYPIAVTPPKPSQLRAEAVKRWEGEPLSVAEREDSQVIAFEDAHDLARAFAGMFDLPSFWIVRSGDMMLCETNRDVRAVPFVAARKALEALGDKIAATLRASDADRWDLLLAAWERRDEGDEATLLAWSAGIDFELASALISDGSLAPPRDFNDAANDNDELRIAARMAGAVSSDQLRSILDLARAFEKSEAPALVRLSQRCSTYIRERFGRDRSFIQGQVAARFARERLKLGADGYVDIFDVVQKLAIQVHVTSASPPTLDGLAIWGNRHGPGIFLNVASERHDRDVDPPGNDAMRVTMAHELCHLLLDGGHAVSAVDVLRSRMPISREQRAKSFAGEFLLPSGTAASAWFGADRPKDVKRLDDLLSDLMQRFGVTRSVAAWKLDHGLQYHEIDLGPTLDAIARYR